jgi:hypothetical protein
MLQGFSSISADQRTVMTRRFLIRLAALVALAAWTFCAGRSGAFTTGQAAADFSSGPWINSKPLGINDLKGRVVLFEVWTYG